MTPHRNLIVQFVIVALLLGAIFFLAPGRANGPTIQEGAVATSSQVSAAASVTGTGATTTPTSSAPEIAAAQEPTPGSDIPVEKPADAPAASNPNQVRRIENPYSSPALSFETVNVMARSALVNIFCSSRSGAIRPISGSGVIIDPRGIILTNAHVAQYVLLAESGRTNLQCDIRTGSPAVPRWIAHVLYIPPVWVDEHAADIRKDKPFGTGSHDYALIYAGAAVNEIPRPATFSYLSPDTREAIGFTGDSVLAASYPAEFLGAITSTSNLSAVTSITTIDDLYTLETSTVDVVSIGSVIGAQSGSSGGAVANAWGRLIAIITTTSDGATTGERKLRGVTLSYIDRDIMAQSGSSLSQYLSADPAIISRTFWSQHGRTLVDKILEYL